MVDIIIPAYNAHETIMDTLFSISYQTIIEKCNVYIINDHSRKNYSEEIKFFSNFINIKELSLEKNSGPGMARQFGIDNSSNDYIVFIDSDDIFYNPFAIETLLNKIELYDADVIISSFLEEVNDGYVKRIKNSAWLHGKIYKRSFLKEKNISFNSIRENEDVGFNQLLNLCDALEIYIDDFTYIWRNNRNSITRRRDKDYKYLGLNNYIKNIIWAIKEAKTRDGNTNKISSLAYSALVYIYHVYLEYSNNEDFKEIIKTTKELYNFSKEYSLSEEKKLDIIENQYNIYYSKKTRKYLLNPIITLKDFINMIEEV